MGTIGVVPLHRFIMTKDWCKCSKLYARFFSFFFFSVRSYIHGLPVCMNITRETDKADFRICNWTGCGLFRGTNRSATNYRSNEWVLTAASLTRNYRRNGKSFIAFEILVFPFLSSSLFLHFIASILCQDYSLLIYTSRAFRFSNYSRF